MLPWPFNLLRPAPFLDRARSCDIMLSRTRSSTLSNSLPADSASEDDLVSSQSQSNSDAIMLSPPDASPGLFEDEPAAPLLDPIALQAAAAVIHIHCPTTVPDSSSVSSAINLTAAGSVERATVGWTDVASHSVVHVLPCAIHYNGPAAVQRYFHPTTVHNPIRTKAVANSNLADASSLVVTATYISTSSLPPDTTDSQCAPRADSPWYTAAFRGRQVTGERIVLPQHTIGLVLRDGGASSGGGGRGSVSAKRHRASAAAVDDDECIMENGSTRASNMSAADEAGPRIDWVVDGWFDAVTLWGRDSDWKGADQSALKRTLVEWPAVAAALHEMEGDVPLVER